MTSPTCGYACVVDTANQYLVACNLNVPCVCRNQNYLQAIYACISSVCSAADILAWDQIAKNDCAAYGATFPAFPTTAITSAAQAAGTATGGSLVTYTVSAAGKSASASAVESTITATSFATASGFLGVSVAPPSATLAASSSVSILLPTSQSTSNSNLSTGAITGIAVGAVAVVLLALVAGLLLWRRNRTSSGAGHHGEAPHDGGEITGTQHDNSEMEGKPPTNTNTIITSIKPPPELPQGPSIPDHHYTEPFSAHELPPEQRAAPIQPLQTYSPAPTYSEVEGHVPSEMDTAVYPPTAYAALTGAAEVDSRTFSPQPTHRHVSELNSSSPTIRYELPTVEPISPASVPALEAPTQQRSVPATNYQGPAAEVTSSAAGVEDAELERMKVEIEAIRAQKERIQQIHAMEERERELSRMIVDRQSRTSRG